MKPDLYVIKDSDWSTYVKEETDAAYENIALPGAFYDYGTDTIYTSSSMAEDALVRGGRVATMLLEHEIGHAWKVPKEDHPTTIFAGFLHAVRCGFDTRAFTRLLRWRWASHHSKFLAWMSANRSAWVGGVLTVKDAPRPPGT